MDVDTSECCLAFHVPPLASGKKRDEDKGGVNAAKLLDDGSNPAKRRKVALTGSEKIPCGTLKRSATHSLEYPDIADVGDEMLVKYFDLQCKVLIPFLKSIDAPPSISYPRLCTRTRTWLDEVPIPKKEKKKTEGLSFGCA